MISAQISAQTLCHKIFVLGAEVEDGVISSMKGTCTLEDSVQASLRSMVCRRKSLEMSEVHKMGNWHSAYFKWMKAWSSVGVHFTCLRACLWTKMVNKATKYGLTGINNMPALGIAELALLSWKMATAMSFLPYLLQV